MSHPELPPLTRSEDEFRQIISHRARRLRQRKRARLATVSTLGLVALIATAALAFGAGDGSPDETISAGPSPTTSVQPSTTETAPTSTAPSTTTAAAAAPSATTRGPAVTPETWRESAEGIDLEATVRSVGTTRTVTFDLKAHDSQGARLVFGVVFGDGPGNVPGRLHCDPPHGPPPNPATTSTTRPATDGTDHVEHAYERAGTYQVRVVVATADCVTGGRYVEMQRPLVVR